LLIILLWGTVKLSGARHAIINQNLDIKKAEDQWTIGQILPVFLLLGPLFSIAGIFVSKIADISPPSISPSDSRVHMGSYNNIIPLRNQGSLSGQVTASRATPELFQDDEVELYNSSHTLVAPGGRVSSFAGGKGAFQHYVRNFVSVCDGFQLFRII
jgi:hypothetical protein